MYSISLQIRLENFAKNWLHNFNTFFDNKDALHRTFRKAFEFKKHETDAMYKEKGLEGKSL